MKIIVFCLPGIGDALMATPMIKLLSRHLPKSTIHIGCMFDGVRYVFEYNRAVSKIIRFPDYQGSRFQWFKAVTKLRQEKYDLAILAYPAYRREYNLIPKFAGARIRIAHRYKHGFISEFHFLNSKTTGVDEKEHIVINNLNLLKLLGINWEKHVDRNALSYDLKIPKKDIDFGKKFLKKLSWKRSQTIGLHPGSIQSKLGLMKRWPIENFAQLAKNLIKKGKKIVIFVGPDEKELGSELFTMIGDKKHVALLDNVKFNQAVGVLNQLNFFITNDNGFAHLANALKIRSLVLFGPTNPLWCAPYDKKITTLLRKARFKPWFRNDMKVTNPPKRARSGMEKISVRDVMNAIRNEL